MSTLKTMGTKMPASPDWKKEKKKKEEEEREREERKAAQVLLLFQKFQKRDAISKSNKESIIPITTLPQPFIHHITISIIYYHLSPAHTSWLDCMTCISGSIIWLYNIFLVSNFLVVSSPMSPRYIQTYSLRYRERGEIRQNTFNALVRIHKYHIWETWKGYTIGNSEFYLKIL